MDDEPDQPRPPKREQLSKTPSWIMLGFALGAACVLAWPRKNPPPVSMAAETHTSIPATPPTVSRALFFEAVFAELSKYAVWEDDLTEIAFWNGETKAFSDRFEVFRSGERFYFRSIAVFTRPVLTHGVLIPNSPLQFTEPQSARDEWLRENNGENVRRFLGTPPPATSIPITPITPSSDGMTVVPPWMVVQPSAGNGK